MRVFVKALNMHALFAVIIQRALVESHFRYADVVWGSLSNTKITALQRLQNRAFEIIQASKIKDSWIRPTFSIDQIFQFDRSVQMFKIINKICPESLLRLQ